MSDLYSLLAGPPIGGALYSRFGYNAPFIFGITVAILDVIGRLLLIERKDALHWGFDPTWLPDRDVENGIAEVDADRDQDLVPQNPQEGTKEKSQHKGKEETTIPIAHRETEETAIQPAVYLSLLEVILELAKSARALVALCSAAVYGSVGMNACEPSLDLCRS